eukprot:TRINITY_DN5890_c0_g1_i3.p1 TRINITY_DN5890_c0_g1~~TRINITY_DN5890_c0_g1_i3.p1  ORF type:complete len:235 (+),score=79.73 TRINITY_DN5890_c0_g1_i3:99-707(+)
MDMFQRAGVPENFPAWAQKVDIQDAKSIWHALDDKVLQLLEKEGYVPDWWMSNVKMALGLTAIGVAVVSMVVPVPFPDNRLILAVCVGLYALFSSIMQALMTYVEKDCVFLSRPNEKGHRLRVRTRLNGRAEYKVVVDCLASPPPSLGSHISCYITPNVLCTRQHTASVGSFFDDRGILYVPGVEKVLQGILSDIRNLHKKK